MHSREKNLFETRGLGPERAQDKSRLFPARLTPLVNEEKSTVLQSRTPADKAGESQEIPSDFKVMYMTGFKTTTKKFIKKN